MVSESDDYNSDKDDFLYLMKIVLGACALVSAIFYGWKNLYPLHPVRMMALLLLL